MLPDFSYEAAKIIPIIKSGRNTKAFACIAENSKDETEAANTAFKVPRKKAMPFNVL